MTDIAPPLPAFSDESLARLSPAQLTDLLVRDEDRAPRNLIEECARRGEEMALHLGGLLEDGRSWNEPVTHGEWWLRLHAVMILGLIPSERAGLLLVAFMRRMSQAQDDNLQDWLAGYWPALLRNKPESVLPALREMSADRGLDWYIRVNAVDAALAGGARAGSEALGEAIDWAAALAADEREDWTMRVSVGAKLLDFAPGRHRPLLEDLARRQTGPMVSFSEEEVRQAYNAQEPEAEWRRFKDPWAFYSPSRIAARQERWANENAEREMDDRESEDGRPESAPQPIVRPGPKIGRNDPCPCGSGKKYKRCCLAKANA